MQEAQQKRAGHTSFARSRQATRAKPALGSVVARVVGMPNYDGDGDGRDDAYERLDYFARGVHRDADEGSMAR